MKRIVLLSCVSQKRSYKSKAKDLYISQLFQKSLAYAQTLRPDAIFILSAKYGLLELDEEIEPYNETLNNMPTNKVKLWAKHVLHQMEQRADLQEDHFIFLAGDKYRRYLIPFLSSFEIPMEGLPIGKQLQFLTNRLSS